ncbi:hypothetical protein COW99_01990 [Candidatus Roizmanbacteria bacterium CG22_combo_CG10-13_8_21_14_all_38_20]|uniref:Uncharacterized protein n=1 Tax=Candidatus Roizmanbacteria bacterium CG22_combo_CG10-13_8_21_14_all_38_20 TaxID=1974862 RepID=A0A2H0BVW3_9BACT|nr:MAG: hypothetical protein COW99_01990 [Candidatus Roizmanbacteria bacterium CG22_combo_CG10-13_8_21_14_all_38_20]
MSMWITPRMLLKQKERQIENSSPNPFFSICDIRIQKQMKEVLPNYFLRERIWQNRVRIEAPSHCPETSRAKSQRKMPFPFSEKIGRAQIRKASNIFLWGCRAERGSGGVFCIFFYKTGATSQT